MFVLALHVSPREKHASLQSVVRLRRSNPGPETLGVDAGLRLAADRCLFGLDMPSHM